MTRRVGLFAMYGLLPGMEYRVCVMAVNGAGVGEPACNTLHTKGGEGGMLNVAFTDHWLTLTCCPLSPNVQPLHLVPLPVQYPPLLNLPGNQLRPHLLHQQ